MTEWEKWSENKREWQTFSFRFFSFDGRFVTFSGGCERNNNFIGKRVFRIHHCLSLIRLFANARSGKTYGLRIVFAIVCVVHAWDWTRFSRINVNTGKPKAGPYISTWLKLITYDSDRMFLSNCAHISYTKTTTSSPIGAFCPLITVCVN